MERSANRLPETPEQHFQYFHWLMLHGKPPQTKWSIGVQAAQLWVDYHEQGNDTTELLLELVRVLMPHRFEGSGFLNLWGTVLSHVQTLPVSEQAPVWMAVFNPSNQGDGIIPHNDHVEFILRSWLDVVSLVQTSNIVPATLEPLVKAFGPTFVPVSEWRTLAYAINNWAEKALPEYSFMIRLIEQHNAFVKQ